MTFKSIAQTLLIITVSFELGCTKIFSECEFVEELYKTHEIPCDEIYKHFCIANTLLHTSANNAGFIGIYKIGTQWWCGEEEPGGNCNVKCSDLLDDDIADDVACANKVLESHGLDGWGRTEDSCRIAYQAKTETCLSEIEVLVSLQNMSAPQTSMTTTTTQQPTIPTTISTSTARPTTTTTRPWTTTSRTTTRRPSTTTTEEPSISDEIQMNQESTSHTSLFIVIALFLIVASAGVVYKQQELKRFFRRNSSSGTNEFENALIA